MRLFSNSDDDDGDLKFEFEDEYSAPGFSFWNHAFDRVESHNAKSVAKIFHIQGVGFWRGSSRATSDVGSKRTGGDTGD